MNKLLLYIVLFIFLMYFPGVVFSYFYIEEFNQYYRLSDYNYISFFCFFLFFCLVFFVVSSFVNHSPGFNFNKASIRFKKNVDITLSCIFLLLSLYFTVNFSSDFRHSSRISESGILVSVLWIVKPMVSVIIVSYVIEACNYGYLTAETKRNLIIIFFSMLFSLTSSMQILHLLIVILLFTRPNLFRVNFLGLISLKGIGLFALLIITMLVAVVIGLANKVGSEKIYSLEFLNVLHNYLGSILPRISSSFTSLLTILNDIFNANHNFDFTKSVVDTINKRFSLLFGLPLTNDEINVINKYNQTRVFIGNPERAGASPGILASMLYFPFFPVGIIVICLYLSYGAKLIASTLAKKVNIGFLSGFSVTVMLLFFLEAPLNFFYVLDPFTFTVIFFLFYFRFVQHYSSSLN